MSRIVILGGGESGVGSAVLAKVKGFDVFLSDMGKISDEYVQMLEKWEIPFEQGCHTEDLILNADEVIKSPGIPSTAPMVKKIEEKGISVISEIEFAGRYDDAKKICITGSNGKTTTTSLIYHLLCQAGLNVGLGGNIGKSYAYQVATEKFDIYVLELSSFQLDNMYDFKADIAIITNITPDHLDRYGYMMENYVKAKFRVTRNMSSDDCFIFCSDDDITVNHLNQIVMKAKMLPFTQKTKVEQGAYVDGDRMIVRFKEEECDMYLQELALGGKHNIYNSMAAALAAKAMDIDNEVIRDGWYITGDIARMSRRGFITITGRLSRFSKIAGEMVPHELVEREINNILCPEYRLLAVCGANDAVKGEKLIVFYCNREKLAPEQVVKKLREKQIPNLWIPKLENFIYIPQLPLLGNGKLDLASLNQEAAKYND